SLGVRGSLRSLLRGRLGLLLCILNAAVEALRLLAELSHLPIQPSERPQKPQTKKQHQAYRNGPENQPQFSLASVRRILTFLVRRVRRVVGKAHHFSSSNRNFRFALLSRSSYATRHSPKQVTFARVRMHNIKLTVAYDGTDFHGWQIQPGQPPIQGFLMDVIQQLTQQRLNLQGAGRTDAGVHAW